MVRISLLLSCAALPAYAEMKYENSTGGSFLFYGQFSPSYVMFDDGREHTNKLTDNAKANTRVGFWIRQPFGENELSFNFETALGFRQSDGISQTSTPDSFNWDRTRLRHVEVIFSSPKYGKFYLGQGSMASDGVGSNDLSETFWVADPYLADFVGSEFLRQKDGALSSITMGQAFANFDGGRYGRVRYDTPQFHDFHVAVSYGENILNTDDETNYYDIALKYNNTFSNGVEVAGGVGYKVSNIQGGGTINDTFGSVSAKLPSGWNATLTAGSRNADNNGSDGTFYIGKLGYVAENWFSIGKTALAVDYYRSDDMVTDGDSGDSFGLEVVQYIDKYDLKVYYGFRHYSYDDDSVGYENAVSNVFGVTWSF